MCKYLLDHYRVFDTGNHFDGATTYVTGRYIDIEYSFQTLRPTHRGMLLHRRSHIAVYLAPGALASFCWCYQGAMLAIRREHAVESSQVSPGLRRQGSKPSDEIQWLEDDVGSAIPIRCLQLVAGRGRRYSVLRRSETMSWWGEKLS